MSSTESFLEHHKIHVVRSGVQGVYAQQVRNWLQLILEPHLADVDATPIVIGVSGGSMPELLAPILKRTHPQLLERIVFFPVDERLVPIDHQDSNVGAYLKLLEKEIPSKHFLQVEHIADAKLAAGTFEEKLRAIGVKLSEDGFPMFDVLFLGLGPDGHTCSLFPGHHLLYEESKWVTAIEDSPKPPPRRVTVTLPVLRNAKHVAFLVTGESKAEVLRGILVAQDTKYPPVLIKPKQGVVEWILDEAAASLLQTEAK